jgi:hypothetical protein
MNEQTTTTVPSGWVLMMHYPNGKPPARLLSGPGKSLSWCQRTLRAWRESRANNGEYDLVIEPADGWESIQGDPLAAICWALWEHDITCDVAVTKIRELMGEKES